MMEQHFSFFGHSPFELIYHSPGTEEGDSIFEDEKITVRAIPLKHRTHDLWIPFQGEKEGS